MPNRMFHSRTHLNFVIAAMVIAFAFRIRIRIRIELLFGYPFFFLSKCILFRMFIIGRYGFLLPAEFIIPNAVEVLDGVKAMVKKAKSLRYF